MPSGPKAKLSLGGGMTDGGDNDELPAAHCPQMLDGIHATGARDRIETQTTQ